ncbi:TPA: hypothetical protein SB591_001118 [Campylobacter coli]|nr:hypothetical protein [Campylobacter coli]HEB9286794.1 hypothetical protein [Campylobacter coli]HEB9322209.1 hypothetical protein [Campylobacter coli]HEG0614693.1 hypothetical protein [Campylobacter coli]
MEAKGIAIFPTNVAFSKKTNAFFTELEDQFLKEGVGNKSAIKLDFEYYILYCQFLQIDKESLFYGRNYELVFCFLLYYRALLNKNNTQKIVAKIINVIRCQDRLPEKVHYREKIICMDNQHRDLSQTLSSCIAEFYNSIDLYNTFRKNIGFENRKKIAIEMLNRASEHYGFFGLSRGGITYKEEKISCVPIQALDEFHHGMSHLCAVFLKEDGRYTNLERAIPHFKRGMMEVYKTIIRDFMILNKDALGVKQEALKIRELEYQTIGKPKTVTKNPTTNLTNKKEEKVIPGYKELCEKIVSQIKNAK